MDHVRNPFAPGAGTPPPELAGRDELLDSVELALQRVRARRPTKSVILIGVRGVGKTVLLNRMRIQADQRRLQTVGVEAPEGRSLPAILAPELRSALLRLSREERAKNLAQRGLRAIAGFARALKVKYQDLEVAIDFEPELGLADSGDLEHDLHALIEAVAEAASAADTALILFIDEMQYVPEEQLAALIVALHRTSQQQLPVVLVGAGLPQLRGLFGGAKSYAERMFDFPFIGPLPPEAAAIAITRPIEAEEASIEPDAVERIVAETEGYPYFLQEWGKHTWDAAPGSPITVADVLAGSSTAVAALDSNFFRVRFDRLTPNEKRYLRAMADLGPGPHRSGDIAERLGKGTTAVGFIRASLISKGMVWSPTYGDTAFTVPLFDEFMRRIMPGDDWLRGS